MLHQLTLEELLRRAGSERQGGKAQECCRISRLSDAVFRCQDKQETSRVSWGSNNNNEQQKNVPFNQLSIYLKYLYTEIFFDNNDITEICPILMMYELGQISAQGETADICPISEL